MSNIICGLPTVPYTSVDTYYVVRSTTEYVVNTLRSIRKHRCRSTMDTRLSQVATPYGFIGELDDKDKKELANIVNSFIAVSHYYRDAALGYTAIELKKSCMHSKFAELVTFSSVDSNGNVAYQVVGMDYIGSYKFLPVLIIGDKVVDIVGGRCNMSICEFIERIMFSHNTTIHINPELSYFTASSIENVPTGQLPFSVAVDLMERDISKDTYYRLRYK